MEFAMERLCKVHISFVGARSYELCGIEGGFCPFRDGVV